MLQRRAKVTDPGVGNCRLTVDHQAYGLNGLDGERLLRFDQRTVRGQVVDPHGFAGVKRSPERTEHLEPHPSSPISGRTTHHLAAIRFTVCKAFTIGGVTASQREFPESSPG